MIVTSYDAFLQSFMTQPPREKIIKSFDMLESSGLKIYTFQNDIDVLLSKHRPLFAQKYSNLFQAETNFKTFVNFRDNLNTKYAYTLNSDKWQIYKNQQNFFGQQLFRWSDELCLVDNLLSAIVINENSIYKNILNTLILETQSAKLLDYWMRRAFYELIDIGRIEKLNYGFEQQLEPLKVEDLKWIWMCLELAFLIDILCFVGVFNSRNLIECFSVQSKMANDEQSYFVRVLWF
ncbi:uncharacterized protein LOC129915113 [Episyrphus balteatus]|uniref:uncharacterized protein LOC129915113 n=1 Tax=Episyrphus balteatus TaxID=286459 RepID=UPI0024856A1C|nr:uncharacterized protein LOC129915113 [Episyrphus balteatus]